MRPIIKGPGWFIAHWGRDWGRGMFWKCKIDEFIGPGHLGKNGSSGRGAWTCPRGSVRFCTGAGDRERSESAMFWQTRDDPARKLRVKDFYRKRLTGKQRSESIQTRNQNQSSRNTSQSKEVCKVICINVVTPKRNCKMKSEKWNVLGRLRQPCSFF